jgi:hypothetical protein
MVDGRNLLEQTFEFRIILAGFVIPHGPIATPSWTGIQGSRYGSAIDTLRINSTISDKGFDPANAGLADYMAY